MKLLLLFCVLFCFSGLCGQTPADSLLQDTAAEQVVRRENFFTRNYPDPRKALLLSFVLPGAGQIYNRKWWKVPIVYGVLGGLTWVEIQNIREYRALRDSYRLLVDGNPDTNPTEFPYNTLDATQTRFYRDQWRRYVEQSSLALGICYLLTATEAFVDAHLSTFDVGDDLSFRVVPKNLSAPGIGPAIGIGFRVQLDGGERYRKAIP